MRTSVGSAEAPAAGSQTAVVGDSGGADERQLWPSCLLQWHLLTSRGPQSAAPVHKQRETEIFLGLATVLDIWGQESLQQDLFLLDLPVLTSSSSPLLDSEVKSCGLLLQLSPVCEMQKAALKIVRSCHIISKRLDVCLYNFPSVSGKAEAGGGAMQVTLCDYIMPWDFLSSTQKKGLSQRYQMGCECKVS